MVVENEIFELGAWLAEAQKRKWTVFYFPALGYWPGPEFNFQPRISCPHPLTKLSRFCVSAGSDWLALGAWPHVYQALVFCWQGFAKHIPSVLALQRNSSGVHCNPGKLNSKLDQGTDWPVDTQVPKSKFTIDPGARFSAFCNANKCISHNFNTYCLFPQAYQALAGPVPGSPSSCCIFS